MLRGDVERCLIAAPGSLAEQWQDELADRFGLRSEVLSRATVDSSYAGNPFAGKNLVIARLHHLARAEDLQARLRAVEWIWRSPRTPTRWAPTATVPSCGAPSGSPLARCCAIAPGASVAT